MQIHGLGNVHPPQQVNAPHAQQPAKPAVDPSQGDSVHIDQLDISPQADLVSRVRDVADVRQDRVDALRAEIAGGTYETDEKLDAAISRLLDEIA